MEFLPHATEECAGLWRAKERLESGVHEHYYECDRCGARTCCAGTIEMGRAVAQENAMAALLDRLANEGSRLL
jgi:ferredoxin